MRTRMDVSALDHDMTFVEVRNYCLDAGYSRLPVYKENLDTVVGVIHTKDFLPHTDKDTFDWHTLVRTAYFVHESKLIEDLLKEFQQKRMHFAVVVDEFGYGGGPSVGERYKTAGGVKPYEITEFGPPGTWESGKNAWGVVPELTSTEKAARYRDTYEKGVLAEPLCLGSYAFTWGNKQEATATWYGLRLPDGSKLGAVDTLTELWSGHKPANLCPVIHSSGRGRVRADGPRRDREGDTGRHRPGERPAQDDLGAPGGPGELQHRRRRAGRASDLPRSHRRLGHEVGDSQNARLRRRLPPVCLCPRQPRRRGRRQRLSGRPGRRRARAALGPQSRPAPDRLRRERTAAPFIPSGYMGNTGAIKMDPQWTDEPALGQDLPESGLHGRRQLGRRRLAEPGQQLGRQGRRLEPDRARRRSRFWARGDKGGEKVSFSFGLIGSDKPFHDTGKGKLENVMLTKDWKQYTIDLKGQDLSRIVTGFVWTSGRVGPAGDVLPGRHQVRVDRTKGNNDMKLEFLPALAGC